jgi:hypothetical protein
MSWNPFVKTTIVTGRGIGVATDINTNLSDIETGIQEVADVISNISTHILRKGTIEETTGNVHDTNEFTLPSGYIYNISRPLITTVDLDGVYTPGVINYVFLQDDGTLRIDVSNSEGSTEILIATISAADVVSMTPSDKKYVYGQAQSVADGTYSLGKITPSTGVTGSITIKGGVIVSITQAT